MITISSKRDGFRRCGVAHGKAETTYDDGRFSAAELAALQAEPLLTVVVTSSDPAEMTVAQLKEELGKLGTEIPAQALKNDLLALLLRATAAGGDE